MGRNPDPLRHACPSRCSARRRRGAGPGHRAATGGGFGGKHGGDVATEAAVMAREVGAPVKVSWSRHEEFTSGTLRPAAVIDVAGATTPDGELIAWTFTNINSGAAAISIRIRWRISESCTNPHPARSSKPRIELWRRRPTTSPRITDRRTGAPTGDGSRGVSPAQPRRRTPGHSPSGGGATFRLARRWRGPGDCPGCRERRAVATVAEVGNADDDLRVIRLVTAYGVRSRSESKETVINQIERGHDHGPRWSPCSRQSTSRRCHHQRILLVVSRSTDSVTFLHRRRAHRPSGLVARRSG